MWQGATRNQPCENIAEMVQNKVEETPDDKMIEMREDVQYSKGCTQRVAQLLEAQWPRVGQSGTRNSKRD
jgi:hypothetical protein